ncbi:MAG: bifunctional nuclease domain-containing protein [Caldilineaceae bacterium]
MSDKNLSDLDLINATLAGEKAAFGELAERHLAMAQRFARQMIADEEVCQELVQEAILQAFLSLDRLRQPTFFAAWLRGILRNLCQNYLRRQRGVVLSMEQLIEQWQEDDLRLIDFAPDPQQIWEKQELRDLIRSALTPLSPKNRITVQLFYFEQHSLAEIAEQLDVSINVVKGRLFQARQQLREQLAGLSIDAMCVISNKGEQFGALSGRQRGIKQRRRKMAKISEIHAIGNAMTESYLLYLLDPPNNRYLPIWIGMQEGMQIAAHLQGEATFRPITLQFMATLLEKLDATLEAVEVAAIKEITYYATVKLRSGSKRFEIDARPSDAIGLALYKQAPILVADELLSTHGQPLPQPFVEAEWLATEQQRLGDVQILSDEWRQRLEADEAFVEMDARAVVRQALAIAKTMNHNYVGTEHLLLALLTDAELPVAQLLQAVGVNQNNATTEFERIIGRGATSLSVEPAIVPRVIHVLHRAYTEASQLGQLPYQSTHILLAILLEGRGMANRILHNLGINSVELREKVWRAVRQ